MACKTQISGTRVLVLGPSLLRCSHKVTKPAWNLGKGVPVPLAGRALQRWGRKPYSTMTILFGNESGIHKRPRASRVMLRTEEFLAGIG